MQITKNLENFMKRFMGRTTLKDNVFVEVEKNKNIVTVKLFFKKTKSVFEKRKNSFLNTECSRYKFVDEPVYAGILNNFPVRNQRVFKLLESSHISLEDIATLALEKKQYNIVSEKRIKKDNLGINKKGILLPDSVKIFTKKSGNKSIHYFYFEKVILKEAAFRTLLAEVLKEKLSEKIKNQISVIEIDWDYNIKIYLRPNKRYKFIWQNDNWNPNDYAMLIFTEPYVEINRSGEIELKYPVSSLPEYISKAVYFVEEKEGEDIGICDINEKNAISPEDFMKIVNASSISEIYPKIQEIYNERLKEGFMSIKALL